MMLVRLVLTAFTLALISIETSATTIPRFNETDISQWQQKEFAGLTRYSIIQEGGRPVLKATASNSASGLYFEKQLSIHPETRLEWRWKISNIFPGIDETTKAGDDYPVRIYVVVSDGPFFWQTRTLVYVWASNQPVNKRWPNAFTSNAVMWSLNSGDAQLNQWISHSRNLYQDLKTAFGKSYQRIEAIAIMSDSDNSQGNAMGWYDNIYLK